MSMKSWTEPGYGFRLYTGDNLGKIREFIMGNIGCLKNPPVVITNELFKYIYEAEDEAELEDALDYPVPWMVAEIIRAKEGQTCGVKGYRSDGDTDQEAMLGIEPSYPWQTEYRSQEDCDLLLATYAEQLGITEKPDYFDAEYYG